MRSGFAAIRSGRIEPDQDGVGFAAGDDGLIYVGGHRDDALTVLATDDRRGDAGGQFGNLAERDFAARRRTNAVLLHMGDGAALVGGQAHEHLHLVPAPLHAGDFRAEERAARLQGQCFPCEPERARFGPQGELDLLDAGRVVRAHVEHALDAAQTVC